MGNFRVYKYKVGDKVTYVALKATDIECPTCRHIETEYLDIENKGVITSRNREYIISHEMPVEYRVGMQDDGSCLITPTIPAIKAPVKENFYKINWEDIFEGNIKGISNG
ncbi:hypothetical protein LCGC14_1574900 [marine sediment metagenome]|uniref:Uncharacterized protein n=1 Tax=marine sediment metagenome TaxID=412755 RepID=A0A0F9IIJ1_9ZZZZ